jgi:hypothetical protein
MPVRPGRLLPSVIVGALVTGALAWGAGTASAAITCRVGGQIGIELGDYCVNPLDTNEIFGRLASTTTPAEPSEAPSGTDNPPSTGNSGGSAGAGSGSVVGGVLDGVVDGVTGGGSSSGGNAGSGSGSGSGTGTGTGTGTEGRETGTGASAAPAAGTGTPVIIQPPSALPAPDVRGGVLPNANLLTPSGAYGGLAATTPVLGFGTFDPALLLAPTGSPLRTLTGVDQGSPVTTVSDVQAMAFDNLPGGLGVPAVTGTLILSAFAAFALRHRVLRRARTAADTDADTGSEADTAEIPAREPVG